MRTFGTPEFLFILAAARWTIALSLIAFVGGALGGLLVALARTSDSPAARAISTVFVQVFQGTPLLLQLFLVFFGAPVLGWDVNPWIAAGVALVLNTSAFLGEIWRGCIESVARTQWEAAECLGLTRFGQYLHVVLPQAARIAIAPTVGFMVQVVKNTSLASVIGFLELSRAGQVVNNSTFQPFTVFLVIAAMYFALCYPLSLASRHFERKLHVGRQ